MRADRVSQAGTGLLIGFGASLLLAGCAAESAQSGRGASAAGTVPVHASGQLHPGSIRNGAQIGEMAAQYATPRRGPVAATGASAWVPPAPPPAFVIKDMPPPPAPAPRPAAAANSQPAAPAPTRSAVDASQLVRPEAAAPQSAPALSAATREQGRKLFADYSCGSCHALADAGAAGSIGPAFDGNGGLTKDYVIETVNDGRGAMPSFAGQMADKEIATLAEYIVGAARK